MIIHGDCLEHMKTLEANSIDSLVTDPPAGIGFMSHGKDHWDSDKGGRDHWIAWMAEIMREALRVLKPGAHGFVWALPRTSHWTATALENAGFEVRDCVYHAFGTGFSKSLDVSKAIDKAAGAEREVIGTSARHGGGTNHVYGVGMGDSTVPNVTAPATDLAKQWQGWGTALKPAIEVYWLVRKPLSEKTVAKNVLKHGTGAINIDASRIEPIGMDPRVGKGISYGDGQRSTKFGQIKTNMIAGNLAGRFPANFVLTEGEAVEELDRQSGVLKSGALKPYKRIGHDYYSGAWPDSEFTSKANTGGASRFFYIAKASKRERGEGNTHPTVKPLTLMTYLIKMITKPGGTVLDPFMGSGTTGVAALKEGFRFIGIERDASYVAIAKARLYTSGAIFTSLGGYHMGAAAEVIALILKFLPDLAKTIETLIGIFKPHAPLSLSQDQADVLKAQVSDLHAKAQAKLDSLVA